MDSILYQFSDGVNICLLTPITRTIACFWSSAGHSATPFGYLMTEITKAYGVPILVSETPVSSAPFGRPNLAQVHLQRPVQISEEEEEAAEQFNHSAQAPHNEPPPVPPTPFVEA